MGQNICEYGIVHSVCRCIGETRIQCPTPDECRVKSGVQRCVGCGGVLVHGDHSRCSTDAEETGRWVKVDSTIHRCPTPDWYRDMTPKITTGDIWQCAECEQYWQVKVEEDPRDGTKWFKWTEVEKVS